ncbi:MAG: bifunctional demethylmenaquinone methyltransferase/2-methoxy-6-polyprenyl-1,4-benzoquinol methylase UbiE [Candidatus Kryptoniota bacterium]
MNSFTSSREKKRYVREMFNGIFDKYDFLNHLLSAGVDKRWRRKAIVISGLKQGEFFLDVACGTGDLSIEASKRKPGKIVAVDFAEKMLAAFIEKKQKSNFDGMIEIVQADAEKLPFNGRTFDVVSVAFGVRNFGDMQAGLKEMHRVLKENGRVVVLEFSKPKIVIFRSLYFFYFRRILPLIGRIFSPYGKAYNYLPESVSAFPDGKEFEGEMAKAGFREVKSIPLTFGIATLYVGKS